MTARLIALSLATLALSFSGCEKPGICEKRGLDDSGIPDERQPDEATGREVGLMYRKYVLDDIENGTLTTQTAALPTQ